MSQQLTIIKPENISTIVSAAPGSYNDNLISVQRCLAAGEEILKKIKDTGMTDELDQQAAHFIEKARKTVKKMNERRSPVTKLFDDIRREFTILENNIDPTKAETLPYQLQQLRNQYAAQKRAQAEARRQEELAKQQAEAARKQFEQEVEEDLKAKFSRLLDKEISNLAEMYNNTTLETYDEVLRAVKEYSTDLPTEWFANLCPSVTQAGIPASEASKIEKLVKKNLEAKFIAQYETEIQDNKDFIIDHLPSTKANLQRIAAANAAEAARMQAEMEERRRKEAEAQEAERKRREDDERQKASLAKKQAEMQNLFDAQSIAQPTYTPKMKVSQKIILLNPEGILPILSTWWSDEGSKMSVDELSKMFKKQITFCEKLANTKGVYIQDESIEYIDDVKAK